MDVTAHCTLEPGSVRFDEEGASAFAKGVAGDFNPIHDPGSRRFCVPGDLLFSVLLDRYGVFEETAVRFAGMLDGGVAMALPPPVPPGADGEPLALHLSDPRGREVLSFFGEGRRYAEREFVGRLSHEYVRFSGRTFPEILVPLMREAELMINPERPLVIYKDMALRVEREASGPLRLTPSGAELSVSGKKGVARLRFVVEDDTGRLGEGEKNLVLSGLRAFDEVAMGEVVALYEERRRAFESGAAEAGGTA